MTPDSLSAGPDRLSPCERLMRRAAAFCGRLARELGFLRLRPEDDPRPVFRRRTLRALRRAWREPPVRRNDDLFSFWLSPPMGLDNALRLSRWADAKWTRRDERAALGRFARPKDPWWIEAAAIDCVGKARQRLREATTGWVFDAWFHSASFSGREAQALMALCESPGGLAFADAHRARDAFGILAGRLGAAIEKRGGSSAQALRLAEALAAARLRVDGEDVADVGARLSYLSGFGHASANALSAMLADSCSREMREIARERLACFFLSARGGRSPTRALDAPAFRHALGILAPVAAWRGGPLESLTPWGGAGQDLADALSAAVGKAEAQAGSSAASEAAGLIDRVAPASACASSPDPLEWPALPTPAAVASPGRDALRASCSLAFEAAAVRGQPGGAFLSVCWLARAFARAGRHEESVAIAFARLREQAAHAAFAPCVNLTDAKPEPQTLDLLLSLLRLAGASAAWRARFLALLAPSREADPQTFGPSSRVEELLEEWAWSAAIDAWGERAAAQAWPVDARPASRVRAERLLLAAEAEDAKAARASLPPERAPRRL
jgi:hypothetical protein